MGLEVWAGCSRKNLRADARVQPRAGGDIERYEKPFAVVLLVASVIWIRSARRKQIVAALTVVLLLGFSLGLQGFATAANFLDLLRSISKLGILGLGMGLIVISRGIDLSEVAMMAGSWCVALTAIPRGLPPFWAAVLALTICVAVGLFNGIMVAFVEAPALFVTLAPLRCRMAGPLLEPRAANGPRRRPKRLSRPTDAAARRPEPG